MVPNADVEISLGQNGAGDPSLFSSNDQKEGKSEVGLVKVHRVADLSAGNTVALGLE